MNIKDFNLALNQIAQERGIPRNKVVESIEQALAAAYKKDYGKKGQIIKAELDLKTGNVKFWQVKMVVDKGMIYSDEEWEALKEKGAGEEGEEKEEKKIRFNPEKHILLEEARKIKPDIKAGEDLIIPLPSQKDYGRIAAQTAKQVIIQKIKEVEKETVFQEYKNKEGEVISGIVQRIEGGNVYFDIGKTFGILKKEEQIPGEFYHPGQRLKVYLLSVEKTARGPVIILSRAYPKFVSKLFEAEVPEISSGQVEIKSIAREPGSRTKIAVFSKEEGIDPIGATVGQRGTRVQVVISELGGEKIDVIEYSDDPKKYIANALSPAKVIDVKILPKNRALVTVAENQLSLAIGRDGQNVRLAAKLTGWKIDVRREGEEGNGEETEEEEKEEEAKK